MKAGQRTHDVIQIQSGEVIDLPALSDRSISTWRTPLAVWLVRLLLLAAFLYAWEHASGGLVRAFYISNPSSVMARLMEWIATGELWEHILVTLEETLIGFFMGSLLGFATGLVLGRLRFLADVLWPIIVAINSLPKVALAPLFILWFGIGLPMKVVLSTVIVFFLVFYNTFTGVRDVDQDLINVIRTMGGRQRDILLKVVVPSALLWVFVGLRISIPYALIGAVVGEIFASNRGIGYLINASSAQFDTAGVFAGLLVLVIISSSLNAALTRLERSMVRWHVADNS